MPISQKFLTRITFLFHAIWSHSTHHTFNSFDFENLLTYACYPTWRSINRLPDFSSKLCTMQSFPAATHAFHVFFKLSSSLFFCLSLSRFTSGFQVQACLVMKSDDFRNVCPIHSQRLFLISSSAGNWFVLSHSRLLMMISRQRTLSILCRQLFINTCTF